MAMTAEERIKRIREYHTEWQRKNPDKVRRYQERYILKRAAELAQENNTKANDTPNRQGGEST